MGFFDTIIVIGVLITVTVLLKHYMSIRADMDKTKLSYLDKQLEYDVNDYNSKVLEGYFIMQKAELARLDLPNTTEEEKKEILARIDSTQERIDDFRKTVNPVGSNLSTIQRANTIKQSVDAIIKDKSNE